MQIFTKFVVCVNSLGIRGIQKLSTYFAKVCWNLLVQFAFCEIEEKDFAATLQANLYIVRPREFLVSDKRCWHKRFSSQAFRSCMGLLQRSPCSQSSDKFFLQSCILGTKKVRFLGGHEPTSPGCLKKWLTATEVKINHLLLRPFFLSRAYILFNTFQELRTWTLVPLYKLYCKEKNDQKTQATSYKFFLIFFTFSLFQPSCYQTPDPVLRIL